MATRFFYGVKKAAILALTAFLVVQNSIPVKAEDHTNGAIEVFNMKEYISADGNYVYPLTPANDEWKLLENYQDKLEVCRIPQEVLKSMTDEQLVQAIADYPLIYDVFFFSDVKQGVEYFAKTCDAYSELLKREGAKDVLLNEIMCRKAVGTIETAEENEKNASETVKMSAKDKTVFDTLIVLTLFQESIGAELSDDEALSLISASDFADMYNSATGVSELSEIAGIMKTPNGSLVSYLLRDCVHSYEPDFHEKRDSEIESTYGVTLVSAGTCCYNCHSYAWYSQSPDNNRWINDPSPYMDDGSYTRVMSGNISTSSASVMPGDIVVYGGMSHSAIVVGSASGEPIATRTLISKWGAYGVFMHRASQVPTGDYDTSEISVWRR